MYSQTFTVAAASLTGHASNVTGAIWVIATPGAADLLGHHVTIRNDSATDHSAKTIILVGTGANDEPLTETLAAPGVSATVTSLKAFKTLTSATPSATIGADTFDIGWAATAHSPWVSTIASAHEFSVSVAVIVGGTINYDVQHVYGALTEDNTAFNHSILNNKTVTDDGQYVSPVNGVRVDVNSHTSGVFILTVLQGGST